MRINGAPRSIPFHPIAWAIKLGFGLLLIAVMLLPVFLANRANQQARDIEQQSPVISRPSSAQATPIATASPASNRVQATNTRFTSVPLPALRPGQPWLAPAGRSPIPQPGEQIKYPPPPRRLVPEPSALPAPTEPILWGEAHRYVGRHVTVEGTIVNANNIGSICFLNFSPDWRNTFYLVVFEDTFADFPKPPEAYFLNQRIQAQGEVTLHKGRPQLQIHKANQIKIVATPGD